MHLLSGGVIILGGGSASTKDIPTDEFGINILPIEAEMSRVRAEFAKLEAEIQLARADECEAMLTLRQKQLQWEEDHREWEFSEEDAEYMAFIEPEFEAAQVARTRTFDLQDKQRASTDEGFDLVHAKLHEAQERQEAEANDNPTTAAEA